MISNPTGDQGNSRSIEETSSPEDPRRPEMGGSETTLGQCRGNGERMSDLERAIGKVTAAIGQAEDVEVIADLVAERRAMRVELEELRRRAADNVVDLSRFR
jgi:hypothetical protein